MFQVSGKAEIVVSKSLRLWMGACSSNFHHQLTIWLDVVRSSVGEKIGWRIEGRNLETRFLIPPSQIVRVVLRTWRRKRGKTSTYRCCCGCFFSFCSLFTGFYIATWHRNSGNCKWPIRFSAFVVKRRKTVADSAVSGLNSGIFSKVKGGVENHASNLQDSRLTSHFS